MRIAAFVAVHEAYSKCITEFIGKVRKINSLGVKNRDEGKLKSDVDCTVIIDEIEILANDILKKSAVPNFYAEHDQPNDDSSALPMHYNLIYSRHEVHTAMIKFDYDYENSKYDMKVLLADLLVSMLSIDRKYFTPALRADY